MKDHAMRCCAALLLAGAVGGRAETIVLDGRADGAVFEGLGALSAGASSRLLIDYPEPQRSEILDFLFKPHYGAALHHLKVEIGGDVDSTDGTEPSIARTRDEFAHPKPEYFNRGYEWWLMKEAKKRNPVIVFDVLQWGAPGWIGGGKFYSQDNADHIVAFIEGAKSRHDLDISYCGIWNEKPYDVEWIKLLRQTLNRAGLQHVQIVAADEVNRWTIADRMAADPALRDAVQVIGTHYPKFQSSEVARSLGKPVWSSEDGPWNGTWSGARTLAKMYNRNYAIGKMTKTVVWSPITSYFDILPLPGSGLMRANQPWSGHYEVQPAIWITAHTTQFIQPGWKYIGGDACRLLPGGGSCVAATSPDGHDVSIVVETMDAKAPQELAFRMAGGPAVKKLKAWKSTEKEQFVRVEDLPVIADVFTLQAEPEAVYSLTTTSGQRKGRTKTPPAVPLPLPYREDFERYPAGRTPRYLSDFYGVFETAKSPDGRRCFQQTMTVPGIQWTVDYLPVSLVGDVRWRDYEVSCDLLVDFAKHADLYGRIAQVPHGKGPPHGYCLSLSADGAWQLGVPGRQLAAGRAEVAAGKWHRIGLSMVGDQIAAFADGKPLGSVTDATFRNGFAGVGCGWEQVKFDDLAADDRTPPGAIRPLRATSSSDWSGEYVASQAIDGDFSTRWNSADGTGSGEWLELDLGKPMAFHETICTQFAKRIRDYRIQYWDGHAWIDAFSGGPMSETQRDRFPSVTAQRVRLLVVKSTETVSIYEIEIVGEN
jgi:hypothetical protein